MRKSKIVCAFIFLFRQVVLQKSWPKVLSLSVGIEPTLKPGSNFVEQVRIKCEQENFELTNNRELFRYDPSTFARNSSERRDESSVRT